MHSHPLFQKAFKREDATKVAHQITLSMSRDASKAQQLGGSCLHEYGIDNRIRCHANLNDYEFNAQLS